MHDVARYFTRADGSYSFARWRRPIAPVAFGLAEDSLALLKSAFQAVSAIARREIAETDPEIGATFMLFAFRDWQELAGLKELAELVPELPTVLPTLQESNAAGYRLFRYESDGAIRTCFSFLRLSEELTDADAEALVFAQAVQAHLTFAENAFAQTAPLALANGRVVVAPEMAELIRVAYDPILPDAASDASHALRLGARMQAV